jgi:hypothetical protein
MIGVMQQYNLWLSQPVHRRGIDYDNIDNDIDIGIDSRQMRKGVWW